MGVIAAFAGAFLFMPAAGASLNYLSIFGFMFVIGVDGDATLVGESIHKKSKLARQALRRLRPARKLFSSRCFSLY